MWIRYLSSPSRKFQAQQSQASLHRVRTSPAATLQRSGEAVVPQPLPHLRAHLAESEST